MAKAKIEKQEEARLKQLQTEDDPNPLPPPPDGGYGWVIVLASFMSNMIVDGVGFSSGLLLPHLITQFGTSKGTTAWVGSILVGFQMGAGPVAGAVANRFGCRVTSITGATLAAAAVALSTLSPNIVVMMLVYGVLGGIGYSFLYLPAVVMVGYYFESKRSLATGISVCGTGVGAFAFAPLVNGLLGSYDWKTTNLYLAGITFAGVLFGALMKPLEYEETVVENVPQQQTRASEGNISAPGIYNSNMSITKRKGSLQPMARADVLYTGSVQNLKEFQSKTSLAEYRHSVHSIQKPKNLKPGNTSCDVSEFFSSLLDFTILREPAFIVFAVTSTFAMAAFYIPVMYLVELAKSKGMTETEGSMMISVIGVTNIVARIAIGVIADFPRVNNFLVNNCCLLLAAAAVAIMPLCTTFVTLAGVCVMFGVGVAGYISLTSILLVEFLGLDKLTKAFGLLILFRGIAASFGSPLAGTLYDITNSYTIPFFVGGAGFGLAGLASMSLPCFTKKTEEKDVEVLAPLSGKDEKNNVV